MNETKKAVITVLGLDRVGITAKVCTALAETNINILDISQTIVGGYFNMVMVVDITNASIRRFLTRCTVFKEALEE